MRTFAAIAIVLTLYGCSEGDSAFKAREIADKARSDCYDATGWSGLLQSENLSETSNEVCALANEFEAQANEAESRERR